MFFLFYPFLIDVGDDQSLLQHHSKNTCFSLVYFIYSSILFRIIP